MIKVIGVCIDGETEWHAANNIAGADYDTLCGIDANDSSIGHDGTTNAKRGQKIECPMCYAIWKGIREMNLKESSFAKK